MAHSLPDIASNTRLLQDQLTCPVLWEPLSQAVCLVPCAHKVQEAAAESIFGATHDGWKVRSDNPCPVCRAPVLGYMTDHSTRNIVKQFFELPEIEINAVLALMKKSLAEKSMSVEKDVLVGMPYPGKPARFIHTKGDWSLVDYGEETALCRCMEFASSTKDSLIKSFAVLGYKNGSVHIMIFFSEKSFSEEKVEEYLKQFDLILNYPHFARGCTKDQLKKIFNILANNNEIPASHFEMIRDLVAKGRHT